MATAPVSVWLPRQLAPVHAGTFEWEEAARTGQFRYGKGYLDNPSAVALDPIHLPLRGAPARTRKQEGVFGVLRDAGPDSWGKAQMRRRLGMPSMDAFERITLCSTNGAGRVRVGDASPQRDVTIWDLHQLETAYASWIASGDRSHLRPIEEFVAQRAPYIGSGGAKPKLDLLSEGRMWLVKFPERGDPDDLAGIEAAALSLARACGIETPAHRVQGLSFEGDTRYGLMVERFDRQAFAGGFARHGLASAHTVMDLDAGDESGRQRSYLAFAHEAVRWCATGQDRRHGQQQKREIWRRVVFNGLVANTDDHSRNHALLQDGASWRLSPIFDVVPVPQRAGTHIALNMPFTNEREFSNYVTRARLLGCAAAYGWDVHEAEAELQRMAAVVNREWEPLMGAHGVSRQSIDARSSAFGFARQLAGGGAA